jgi:hypothetical protein
MPEPCQDLYAAPFVYWGGGLWLPTKSLAERFVGFLMSRWIFPIFLSRAPNGWEVKVSGLPRLNYQNLFLLMMEEEGDL